MMTAARPRRRPKRMQPSPPQQIEPLIAALIALSPARAANLRTLDDVWARRPCFICDRLGWCQHREPVADVAEADGLAHRMLRADEAA